MKWILLRSRSRDLFTDVLQRVSCGVSFFEEQQEALPFRKEGLDTSKEIGLISVFSNLSFFKLNRSVHHLVITVCARSAIYDPNSFATVQGKNKKKPPHTRNRAFL